MANDREPLLAGGSQSVNHGAVASTGDDVEQAPLSAAGNVKNQLGTINGAYVPCLLNIMGIVLFLRLSWATGEAGALVTLAILAVSGFQAILTVLSLSALVTNGVMSSGGSYYMISRCLGPEFGGAIGVLFYSAYAMGVSFYSIGFATAVQTTFMPDAESPEWTIRWVGSCGLFFVLLVSLKGADFFAKFNVFFFLIQFLAILVGLVSFWIPHTFTSQITNSNNGTTFEARAKFPDHLSSNLMPDYTVSASCLNQKCEFHTIFALLFPMVTGIMEGANLSGDLKDPAHSIPLGTLSALATALVFYTGLILSFAGSFTRHTLHVDQNVFQNATMPSRYVVVVGILISAISSALGSLFGGSRVLQAMARDDLFSIMKPFKYGTPHGDEPRVAVLFTWFVAQCCVMIGDLDVVAPIETSFFCLSYAVVNLACFFLSAMEAPNFRPRFKYYSWQTALLGALANLAVMVYLQWIYALITLGVMAAIYVYLTQYGPVTEWGDISNELIFHQVRKYLLRMEATKAAPSKFWKPNLLILVDNCDTGLLAFCNSVKKGGLMVLAQVIVGSFDVYHRVADTLRLYWGEFVRDAKLKAFVHTTCAEDARAAYRVLISASGLGGLSINTVVMPFYEISGLTTNRTEAELQRSNRLQYTDLQQKLRKQFIEPDEFDLGSCNLPVADAAEYCGIMQDAIMMQKNVIVGRNFSTGLRGHKGRLYTHTNERPNVDIWIWGDWSIAAGDGSWDARMVLSGGGSTNLNQKDLASRRQTREMDSLAEARNDIELERIMALLLQLGYLFSRGRIGPGGMRKNRKLHRLRIFHILGTTGTDIEAQIAASEDRLTKLCDEARIPIEAENIKVVSLPTLRDYVPEYKNWCQSSSREALADMPIELQARCLNAAISLNSADTSQVFLPLYQMPGGSDVEECQDYLRSLSELTKNLPPCALVADGGASEVISTQM